MLLKGVISVSGSVRNVDDWINRERVRNELHAKLYEMLSK